LEKDGAEAAVTKLRSEVDAMPERDRQAYSTALLKQLQGDSRNPNILPDMAIAFGMQNPSEISRDSSKPWVRRQIIDSDKITAAASRESNPIYQELYRELGTKYRSMRSENTANGKIWQADSQAWTLGGANVFKDQFTEELRLDRQRTENRRTMGILAAKPELFKGLSVGGQISHERVKEFQDQWNQSGAAGESFRKKYASTPDEQRRIGTALENLRTSFDDERNKYGQRGSLLENNINEFLPNWTGIEWFADYGQMTEKSLLDGLGYRSLDEARKRLPADAGGKPIPEVTSLSNYDNTKLLNRNDGPMGVAKRMLSGQASFFKDEPGGVSKAVADLTAALGVKAGNHDERAVNQVSQENRDKVIQAIQETGNTRLRDWFVSRYPQDMASVAASAVAAGPLDNASTKVVAKKGPDEVARNMLSGSGLDASARADLSKVLHKELDVNWKSVRAGTPLITAENLEAARAKIEATKNAKLIEWFETKYPRR